MYVRPSASRSLFTTFTEDIGPDVFALDCQIHPNKSRILLNLSSYTIELCDTELRSLGSFAAHSDRITSAMFSPVNPDSFYSSSSDGTANCWDARSGSAPTATIKFDSDVFSLTVNQSDNLLVVGIENTVVFYDRRMLSGNVRQQSRLGAYADVHSDEITQLLFHPSHPNILASSGEDGLICLYDVSASEASEAAICIMNTDCTVNKFGFFGPNGEGMYSISSVETLSIWHHPSAQRLAFFTDIREQTGMDYLVDCIETSPEEELILLTGSHDGNMSVVAVNPSSYRLTGTKLQGHTSTIRSAGSVFYSTESSSKLGLITTSEDGLLQRYSNILPDHTDQFQSFPSTLGKRRADDDINHDRRKVGGGRL